MKLISLNTWGGKYFDPLINFIKQYSQDIDIFCLQEIYDTKSDIKQYKNIIRANLLGEIKNILLNFQVFYFPTLYGFDDAANPTDFDLSYGSAIFVSNKINIIDNQNYFIYQDKNFKTLKKSFSNLATPLQYISFNFNSKQLIVFNFHGTPYPANKLDSQSRLDQSKKVVQILDSKMGAKILVGDFNLLPQTKSIKIFEENMKNLIKEFNVKTTRSNLSPFFGKPNFQKFADYLFVSTGIKVINFQVPQIEISDHLPMILEFS